MSLLLVRRYEEAKAVYLELTSAPVLQLLGDGLSMVRGSDGSAATGDGAQGSRWWGAVF